MEAATTPGASSENSTRSCERAAGLLWPPGAGFPAFGGQPRQKGPEAGTRDAWLPRHNHTRKTLGVQLTEVRGGKAPGVCFRKGPRFPGHHGNPGVPSNNKPAPRGHLRTFAARSEACEALPLVALGFPEPPPRVRQGRDWKNSLVFCFFVFFLFRFFSAEEKNRDLVESLPGKFGC